MRIRGSKFLTGAVLALALACIAGCNQQKNSHEKIVGHARVRTACATEIQKYCANEPRKRRCLRQNTDKLSESCKAALAQRRGRREGGEGNGEND